MSDVLHTPMDADGFRPRGTHGSRIDAFSDVVFGFALALLVVSQQVPKTYSELHAMLKGFIPFALCFGAFMIIWLKHYRFFRRFGLYNTTTIWINAALLFVILFYVYPLKFLYTLALNGSQGNIFSSHTQVRELIVLYGVGVCSLNVLIALLNYQGWRHRQALLLTELEEMLTRSYIIEACVTAGIGLLSCGIAWALPLDHSGEAAWTYLLMVAQRPVHALLVRRRARRLWAAHHVSTA